MQGLEFAKQLEAAGNLPIAVKLYEDTIRLLDRLITSEPSGHKNINRFQ